MTWPDAAMDEFIWNGMVESASGSNSFSQTAEFSWEYNNHTYRHCDLILVDDEAGAANSPPIYSSGGPGTGKSVGREYKLSPRVGPGVRVANYSTTGQFRRYFVEVAAPRNFLEPPADPMLAFNRVQAESGGTIYGIRALEGNYQAYGMPADSPKYYVTYGANPNEPYACFIFDVKLAEPKAAHSDSSLKELTKDLAGKGFLVAYGAGFQKGGVQLIETKSGEAANLLDLLERTGSQLAENPILTITRIGGDAIDLTKNKLKSGAAFAAFIGGLAQKIGTDGASAVDAILAGDDEALQELSQPYQEMAFATAEIIEALYLEFDGLEEHEKAYLFGQMTPQVVAALAEGAAMGGALKLVSKLELLQKIDQLPFFGEQANPRVKAALVRVNALKEGLEETKMCFVPGTLVHTSVGLIPIEKIQPGMLVWSRDPNGSGQAFKKVLNTQITNPDRLLHIGLEDSGGRMEVISCTAEHPFFVAARDEFVPASELVVGEVLSTIDGQTLIVGSIRQEVGLVGGTPTTYNFEVEDFHTYFVGESGVWVHNKGAFCERLASLFMRFLKKSNNDVWAAYAKVGPKFDSLVGADPRLADGGIARLQMFTEARRRHFTDLPSSMTPPPWRSLGQSLTKTNPPADTGEMADELRKNMELVYGANPRGYYIAAHHIIAVDRPGPNWDALRTILTSNNMHLNEAANGIFLAHNRESALQYPSLGKIHGRFHSDAFAARILPRLQAAAANGKTGIQDELQKIAFDIAEGTLP